MVTKNYNNIWYATNLKTKLNILIPREIRCCYFIAFENFYHDFHLLVGSSVSVLTGYPWTEGLLVYGRWCPLTNTGSTAYGLEPGPESVFVLCVCVFFFNIRHRDNNRHRINCSEGQHLSHVQHQYFFLNFFFFFVHDVYEKIKVGLRWSEPIYLHIGYVFESDFAGGMI